jgi:hypothetical protein
MGIKISFVAKFRARFDKCVVGGFRTFSTPVDALSAGHMVYRAKVAPKLTEGHSADLTKYLSKIRYQGNAPSCVGFGTAHAIQIREGYLRAKGRLSRKSIPSESWIYYISRMAHNAIRTPLTGTYIRYALEGCREMGCPSASARPYSDKASKLNRRPTGKEDRAAQSREGMSFQWLYGEKTSVIMSAIDDGYAVVFGTQVTEDLQNYKADTVLRRPSAGDLLLGGHCMAVVGYRVRNGRVEFLWVNSWRGRELVWVDEDYMTWNQTRDLAIIEIRADKKEAI